MSSATVYMQFASSRQTISMLQRALDFGDRPILSIVLTADYAKGPAYVDVRFVPTVEDLDKIKGVLKQLALVPKSEEPIL